MSFASCWEGRKALPNPSGYKVTLSHESVLELKPCPGPWRAVGTGHSAIPRAITSHYHQNEDEKTNSSRQKQGKFTLSQVSWWYFAWLERLGRLGLERIFSPLPQNFITKCCTFCSCFLLFCPWEITLERSGEFDICSLSRIGGWCNSALFLRKGAAVGRAPGTRRELPLEHIAERFVDHLVHLQKGLCYLKGFEHECACVWTIAARQDLEVGTKCRGKKTRSAWKKWTVRESWRAMQWGHNVGWKQIFEKVKEADEQPPGIHSGCIQQDTHLHNINTNQRAAPRTKHWSITEIFPLRWEVTPPEGCPQPQASPQGHLTSL